jgi:anaerobic selenocysteine-containing dehydrogenase
VATREVRSYCRICPAFCGVLLTIEDDHRVVKVRGDRDHPISHGYTCPKGRALGELHHAPNRLDAPMIRRDGELVEVSWDEMLDDLAAKLGDMLERKGADAIGAYFGTYSTMDAALYWGGERFVKKLGSRSKFTSGTVDAPCYPVVRRLMAGVGWLYHIIDLERATLTLLIATNPVVSHNAHMHVFPNPSATLRELTRRGELWVIDPRETESARLATRHLAPRPGSDYALLGYLIRELLRDGADREYLAAHATNVEELARAVERFELGEAARATGLAPDDLTDLLAAVRRHGRLGLQMGTGTSMAPAANVTEWLSLALLAVTGSLEREGGVWFNPGFIASLDQRDPTPDPRPEPGPPSRPELPRQGGEYPAITLLDEIEAGNLEALFELGGNLVAALPDAPRVREALRSLPVFAVVDVQHGDMSELATHVLPAAGPLERADVPRFIEFLMPVLGSQHTPAVVPLGGERRPGWWIFAALAERLGRRILPEGLSLDAATDDDVLALSVRPTSRSTFAELKEAGVLIEDDRALGWAERNVLPGGRWNLAPEPLVRQLETLEDTPPLVMIPRRLLRRTNSYVRDLAETQVREPANVLIHPADAADAGVLDGRDVVVESEFGTMRGVAKVDASIRRGAVAIPHGWASSNPSDLLSATERIDPLTGMPTYCAIPVALSAAENEPAVGVLAEQTAH